MRNYFDNLCEIAGFKPKIVAEGDFSLPVHPRAQAIFWKKEKELSPHASAFKSFLLEYYKKYSS